MKRAARLLRRLGVAIAWLLLATTLSLGGAGIVAQMSHPPGTPARAELTWDADRTVAPALDAAAVELTRISTDVDRLADMGRAALTAVKAADPDTLKTDVDAGASSAAGIESASTELRRTLVGLPGDLPSAAFRVDQVLLGRRSATLAALDITSGLSARWADLTDEAMTGVKLIGLLLDHDATVASAAAQGRSAHYAQALTTLDTAKRDIADARDLQDDIARTADVSVLDEWLRLNDRYDTALRGLYVALRDSKGKVTDVVKEAYKAEGAARAKLPPDTRGLVVIVSDYAQGGLNQAVLAIQQARSRLDLALEAIAPAG